MTSARLITPPGRSAIAVIEITGARAVEAADERLVTAGGKPLAASPPNRVRFGTWGGVNGEEVVAVVTPEKTVEVHCHGGSAATRAILASLASAGVTTETTPPPPQSLAEDARSLLTTAPTERVAGILLDQANGALDSAIAKAIGAIDQNDVESASTVVAGLLAHRRLSRRLVRPWRVVITGQPNVGKSSLINALIGFERAVVFDQPGTTRDVVTATTAIDGWPVQLIDTAGIRQSDDALERAGVELAESEVAAADVIVRVRDASSEAFVEHPSGLPLVYVANKSDLATGVSLSPGEIATVAPSSEGVATLLEAIGEAFGVTRPPVGEAIPFRDWHLRALAAAEQAVGAGMLEEAGARLQALLTGDDSAG